MLEPIPNPTSCVFLVHDRSRIVGIEKGFIPILFRLYLCGGASVPSVPAACSPVLVSMSAEFRPQDPDDTEQDDDAPNADEDQVQIPLFVERVDVFFKELVDQGVQGRWARRGVAAKKSGGALCSRGRSGNRCHQLVRGVSGKQENVRGNGWQGNVCVTERVIKRQPSVVVYPKGRKTHSCMNVSAFSIPAILVPIRQLTTSSAAEARMVPPKVVFIAPLANANSLRSDI